MFEITDGIPVNQKEMFLFFVLVGVFFVQDMLDSPHLPDDSCDTLGPFCS